MTCGNTPAEPLTFDLWQRVGQPVASVCGEKGAGESRPRGQIRPRGNAATEAKARRALTRLTAQVDEKRHAKTNASFQVAMETWLRTHEIEETTRASYEQYARVRLYRRSATSQSIA